MAWIALVFVVAVAILHMSSATFLSTIDEYKKMDSNSGTAPLKRYGGPGGPSGGASGGPPGGPSGGPTENEEPMPEDSEEGGADGGARPSFGADEGGQLDCNAIMRQCQCSGGRQSGGVVQGGNGGKGMWGGPTAQQQQKTFGFDEAGYGQEEDENLRNKHNAAQKKRRMRGRGADEGRDD